MSIGKWIAGVVLATAACGTALAQARGPAVAVGAGMHGGGGAWHGGGWHGGGWHHDGHSHSHVWYGASVGIYLGPGVYWGWPYAYYDYDGWPYYDGYGPYSYVYAYPNVTFAYPTNPSYYVTPSEDAAPEPPSFRYYCSDPKGYYPEVAHCTQAWLRVLPSDAPPAPPGQ